MAGVSASDVKQAVAQIQQALDGAKIRNESDAAIYAGLRTLFNELCARLPKDAGGAVDSSWAQLGRPAQAALMHRLRGIQRAIEQTIEDGPSDPGSDMFYAYAGNGWIRGLTVVAAALTLLTLAQIVRLWNSATLGCRPMPHFWGDWSSNKDELRQERASWLEEHPQCKPAVTKKPVNKGKSRAKPKATAQAATAPTPATASAPAPSIAAGGGSIPAPAPSAASAKPARPAKPAKPPNATAAAPAASSTPDMLPRDAGVADAGGESTDDEEGEDQDEAQPPQSTVPATGAASPATPDEEAVLLMIVLFGFLGGLIHMMSSLAQFVGNRLLLRSWIVYYITIPFGGAALAPLIYLLLRVGVLSPGMGITVPLNYHGLYAFAGLAGLFSKQAIEMLAQVFEVIFKKVKAKDPADGRQEGGGGATGASGRPPATPGDGGAGGGAELPAAEASKGEKASSSGASPSATLPAPATAEHKAPEQQPAKPSPAGEGPTS